MQIIIGTKYRKTGPRTDFTAKPGDIIIVTKVQSNYINYHREDHIHETLGVPTKIFHKEYSIPNKKISLKGIG